MKYNLTFWQKVNLFFTYPIYLIYPEPKKTWHEVKKGMEKHECKYTKPFMQSGYFFYKCEHEGCNLCDTKRSEYG